MKIDFLLIGGGLAGSALGYRLIQAGKSIRILDQPEKNQSSRIAAGLYNPVTGRKMVKTWLADQLFPEIEPFYKEIEEKTGVDFLRSETIYRPFISIEEQNEWMGNSSDEAFIPYIRELVTESQSPHLNDPYGGVMLQQSGWLDIPTFLNAFKEKFSEYFQLEEFTEENLHFDNGSWHYRDLESTAVVFCNGVHSAESSFFGFLPFAPVKGEILEVKQEFCPDYIVNRGVFRVHLGEGIHRVGSTYTWHDLDIGPTERAKNELLERLQVLVNLPVKEVVSHKFGIRPATKDRKPFLGKHPRHSGVYIFNGFGAKGVSLVPFFSKVMEAHLLRSEPIMKEVDIARYFDYI
ncbi:NAD(P)/FAD-dependent oxidoreductase [Algoriphagus limi]|uniref:FAD-binding oxidoreductase n=1 Tax=Algoriphagus limi TaxID=2975273 RepID=A0ABT2G4C7_9BACT|nr:FAD-dependent oxidoreductase [Algoriphagus limi]MCS5490110.1 FAD-binding oxidoreductase [Algoriphagus limi]